MCAFVCLFVYATERRIKLSITAVSNALVIISNAAANTELPLTLTYSTTDCNVNTACGH